MAKRPVQFFTSRNPPELPIDEYPALLLAPKRLWNDYNYKTLFELFLLRSSVTPKSLGEIKIYQHETKTTSPPRQFEQLEDTFCSLGQTTEFY
ncbi:MAG: hypothetical protein ACPG4T_23340, partial [Nannocystaceae bacterium]